MLRLTMASAGSGKTHKLAYTYIKLFITRECEDGSVRLRSPKELRDSHSHILAITFTNKATNEMKERIVERLAGLATGNKDATYMRDFCTELGVGTSEIALTCREALGVLLYNYSDFLVQTIDSFFQTVLRTFAYEIEIDDNYQVELNDDYLTQMGIDSTLSTIKENEKDNKDKATQRNKGAKDTRMFINMLLEQTIDKGQSWNLFNKHSMSQQSMYGALLSFAKLTGAEAFKHIQGEMTEYMKRIDMFSDVYRSVKSLAKSELEVLYADVMKDADTIRRAFADMGYDVLEVANSKVVNFIKNADKATYDAPGKIKAPELTGSGMWSSNNKALFKAYPDWDPRPDGIDGRIDKWRNAANLWKLYLENLHYLGVLQPILRNIDDFRKENNLIQLSDTNSILQRIINDDDTPFIYERLGYYLHHYLIDEFQDTSRMQWMNLRPLVNESLSTGHANLIIGDAKQSIYRFRNAEPDLITTDVPAEFAHCCEIAGQTPGENSNYRSQRRIIMFNNTLFSILPGLLDQEPHVRSMASLYSNARQMFGKADNPDMQGGYVEINFTTATDDEYEQEVYDKLGPLVDDIRSRGFKLNDIAFLVETHTEGSSVIEALMRYNQEHSGDAGFKPIDFVSDESLRVSDSAAVRTVVSVLQRIVRKPIKGDHEYTSDIDRFCSNYNMLLNKYPTADRSEVLMKLIDGTEKTGDPSEITKELRVLALPALVEKVMARYLTPEMRNEHAAYLTAFVDTVLDYCENYPTDTASFLKWWSDNSSKITISSPDGTDAVTIMTIHKSKGLEFPCVIMPKAKANFKPSSRKMETLWVKPQPPCDKEPEGGWPPYVPVLTREDLLDTPHAALYKDYADKVKMDALNKMYVAMTRAENELYIFTKISEKVDKKTRSVTYGEGNDIGAYLYRIFGDGGTARVDVEGGMNKAEGDFDSETMQFTYGEKMQAKPEKEDKDLNGCIIDRLIVNDKLAVLCENEDDKTTDKPLEARYGTALHGVMEHVYKADDLNSAIDRAVRRRRLAESDVPKVRELLAKRIAEGETYGWFKPETKVLNEWTIIIPNKKSRRADRVEIRPDGTVCVIDYKFEADPEAELSEETMNNYREEVRRYMTLLKECGVARGEIEGWLWFMHSGHREKC